MIKHYSLSILILLSSLQLSAQQDIDIDQLLQEDISPKTEYIRNAFKSTRVINGQSMEMLGEGVLDFRILHRFGLLKSGISEMFGLDQASMRIGFDYGVHKNLTLGVGRSTFRKEFDGYVKYRMAHQRKGAKPFPLSILWTSGITMHTLPPIDPRINYFSNRLSYFHQAILGRKMGENFTLQLSPTFVHRNLVERSTDKNDMIAIGIGTRIKTGKRTAFIIDTYPILYGKNAIQHHPLSLGIDVETGGHVFQLHITNARGMNEKAFMTETFQNAAKGEFQIGFNLSRVFTVKPNTSTSW